MGSPHVTRKAELRLFISSTFRDLQEEREYLIKKVFPELRALCRSRGVSFTEVDLRWGLTEEQQRLGRIIRTCLEEIDRCRPYFIGIIGRRYGWTPEYHEVAMDPDIQERYPWIESLTLDGGSLLEMEFTHGALNDGGGQAYFYRRKEEHAAVDNPERLEQLVEKIIDTGRPVHNFETPEQLGEAVRADLLEIIESTWPANAVPSVLERERLAHNAFAHSRRRAYIANPEYLTHFNHWLSSRSSPLVIAAESGMGKSALIAWLVSEYLRKNPHGFVIEHYVGASDDSTDHIGFMRRVIGEIKERYAIQDSIPTDTEELERVFPEWLARVGEVVGFENDILLIALDSIDQFQSHSRSLSWLANTFPPKINLLISCRDGETLDRISTRQWETLELRALKEREREAIVARYLAEYHKSLPPSLLLKIGKDEKSSSPLFLRTLSEELRLYGDHESLVEVADNYLNVKDLDQLFVRTLERMENDYGVNIVRVVTMALALSRAGLAETHLLGASGLARVELSMLLHALDYHLLRTNGRINFFHKYLQRAVESRYLSDPEVRSQTHRSLSEYFSHEFQQIPLTLDSGIDTTVIREMLYQLSKANQQEKLREALLSPLVLQTMFDGETEYEFLHYWKKLGEKDIALLYEQTAAGSSPKHSLTLARLYRAVGAWDATEKKLEEVVADDANDDTLVAFGSLGDLRMLRGKPTLALESYQEQHRLALERSDADASAAALGGIGAILLQRGDYETASSQFMAMLQLCQKQNDRRGVIRALTKIGQIHLNKGEYDLALQHYRSAMEWLETTGDRRETSFVLGQIGLVYWNIGEFEKAMDCFNKEMHNAEDIGDSLAYAMAEGKIGLVELDRGDLDHAFESFKKYYELSAALGYSRGIGFAVGDTGIVHLRKKEFTQALALFQKAYAIHHDIDFPFGKALWLRWKAETVVEGIIEAGLFSQHQLESAKEWITQSIDIAHNDGNKDSLFDATVILARVLYLLGNQEEAIRSLTTMLSEATNNVKQAELHFQLWKLSFKTDQGKDDHLSPESLLVHKAQAHLLYQALSDQTKKYHYTSRLAELQI